MNNKRLISIIIPVYNTERYIKQCLDSITKQTEKDFECILVDDGSTDESSTILDKYSKKDDRFIVFHKANGGVSSARNFGLNIAQGEYVIFMDADDLWISPHCLENVKATAISTDADITRFDYKAIDENDGILYGSNLIKYRDQFSNQSITNDIFFSEIIRGEFFGPLLLTRRSTIGDLRFNEGQKFLEDMDFIARLVLKAKKCCYISKEYYGYRKLSSSASNRGNLKSIEDSFNMCYAFHKYAKSTNNQKLNEDYNWYSIMLYVWTLKSISYNEFAVSINEVFNKIDIEKIHQSILKWKKEYKGSKTTPLLTLIPSKIASLVLVCKYQVIKIFNYCKRLYA